MLMGSVQLSPSFVVLPAKIENINGNYERGFKVESIPKKLILSG